jgi:hypothetical protein
MSCCRQILKTLSLLVPLTSHKGALPTWSTPQHISGASTIGLHRHFRITSDNETDDTESFELSGATGQVPTVPNALPDVRASWVDASANTLVGQGFGNGTPSLSQPYSAWQRSTGPTPTNGTGPSGAGEGNFYLLAGASTPGAQTGSVFVLERAAVDLRNVPSDGVASLTFMYHMFGANMGSLRVSVRRKVTPLPNWTEVWSASSGATNAWQTATISLNGYLGSNVDIRIAASRGNGPASDIALDAVRIRTGW